MSTKAPTRVALSWTATSLTTSFGGYRVYRRPARLPVGPWERVAVISVPTGYTAADVEANHNSWTDYEAGWVATGGNGPWDGGWDYAVTVKNKTLGMESLIATATTTTRVQVTNAGDTWLVCNAAPYLNTPLTFHEATDSNEDDTLRVYSVAGSDQPKTRTRDEIPARTWRVGWRTGSWGSIDDARHPRAIAASGRQVALITPQGDRILGVLGGLSVGHPAAEVLTDVDARLVETGKASAVSDYNGPAGLAMVAASSHYAAPSYNAAFNPGSSAFSIVYAGTFTNSAGMSTWGAISGGATRYYGLVTNGGNQMLFAMQGTSGVPVNAAETSATWFDGSVHVAVGVSTGTTQTLYRDGAVVATNTGTHGAIDLTTGGNGTIALGSVGGIASFHTGHHVAGAYYGRALTAAEAAAASYYLLGYPGYRMPPGAAVFYDLRDDRCWDGISTTLVDLSGDPTLNATIVNSPKTRGIPWPLADLDRA